MSNSPSLVISVGVDDKNVKANLAAIGESIKKLCLMTETAFANKSNMSVLGVKPFAETRAEMCRLTKAYRDLATSGKASAGELALALDALRAKNRELYASMNSPPKLAAARARSQRHEPAPAAWSTGRPGSTTTGQSAHAGHQLHRHQAGGT